ncbi:uncharacterized protein LOC120263452 isoform X2 [Dioscorea cayenensis subsp. rotundata]|uniref:Uncharacterized protein LOC120263452 isoform X2 n=1 Tax=Dioscorea cayennensis subsp. rotundata TaxID=55577 RepID=A0AB40BJS4_DIOCR|nr:uncharacterized protein LOC120263452 isoform X2 [Dioscorea cayenensis subsp. rotundata]XP_039127296.1 uncharacterized protein LOC120263452 isoform X2 [Dioscorea cayenensis subsp. rotundata]
MAPLLLLLLFALVIPSLAGKSSGVCVCPGGRFPPFSSEGKAPGFVSRGPRDLALCRVFRKSTCDLAQTYPALLAMRRLASAGEASQECFSLWELLECSICHPLVGVQPGPPLICESFCDGIFQACANAYFSIDAKTQVLFPCGPSDVVCGRASEWVSNVCPSVTERNQALNQLLVHGALLDLGPFFKGGNSMVLEDFRQWLGNTEKVSWAIGGMVLTAGLLFVRGMQAKKTRRFLLGYNHPKFALIDHCDLSPFSGAASLKQTSPFSFLDLRRVHPFVDIQDKKWQARAT